MKAAKLFILSFLLLGGIAVNAQTEKPLTFGVKAGLNVSNFSGDVEDTDSKVGFNIGVTVDYSLTENLYLLSGLEFTMKGSKANETIDGIKVSETANPMFLQLPIHLGYKLPVSDGIKMVFHAGPYVAYGIGGKLKYDAKQGIEKDSKEYDFFDKDMFKRFDFGLGLGVGAEFGKIGVGLGWDFGLTSLARGDAKLRTMNGYLTVGYKF